MELHDTEHCLLFLCVFMFKDHGFLTHRISIRSWPRPSSSRTPKGQTN